MYELEAFLSLLVGLAYLEAIVRGRRAFAPLLVVGLALMVYTHNWALFLCVGLAVATVVVVRERLGLFALVAGAVARPVPAVAPFAALPDQAHRGAVGVGAVVARPDRGAERRALGATGRTSRVLLRRAWASGALVRGRPSAERTAILALSVATGVAILSAWLVSQVSPSWTTRYFAILVGPLLVLAARGIVRAGRFGVAALVVVVFFWVGLCRPGQQGERPRDRSRARHAAPGRARHLDASRAGPRASLLPRARAALRDHARPGRPISGRSTGSMLSPASVAPHRGPRSTG